MYRRKSCVGEKKTERQKMCGGRNHVEVEHSVEEILLCESDGRKAGWRGGYLYVKALEKMLWEVFSRDRGVFIRDRGVFIRDGARDRKAG